jgi:hypothetical protein
MSQQMAGVADVIAPGQDAPAGYWRCHSCAPRPDVLEPKGNRAGREHTRVGVGATRLWIPGQTNGPRHFCAGGSARSRPGIDVGNWHLGESANISELVHWWLAGYRTSAKHRQLRSADSALPHHQYRQL